MQTVRKMGGASRRKMRKKHCVIYFFGASRRKCVKKVRIIFFGASRRNCVKTCVKKFRASRGIA